MTDSPALKDFNQTHGAVAGWNERWAANVPESVVFEASWNIQIKSEKFYAGTRKPQQAKRNEIRTFVNKNGEEARRMEKFFN